jgi:CRP-like cAMP-binding protein
MISVERLRGIELFSGVDETFIKKVAMAAEEVTLPPKQVLYAAEETADFFFILVDGCVEQYLVIRDPEGVEKHFYLDDVKSGEALGLSAVISPYKHTTTARASGRCRVILIDAAALQKLCSEHLPTGFAFMHSLAAALADRLHTTRVQLAATRMG